MAHRFRFSPKEKLLHQRVNLLIVNRKRRRHCSKLGLFASRIYAQRLDFDRTLGKKLPERAHEITTLFRADREKPGTAASGAGSHAKTGTSNNSKASPGVRMVGSKYSVVKARPILNAIAIPKASR